MIALRRLFASMAPPRRWRRLVAFASIGAGLACGLSGCSGVNSQLAAGISDHVPQWAGGLPADAPPRPGTPAYDEFMRERERKRLEPAKKEEAETPERGADTSR